MHMGHCITAPTLFFVDTKRLNLCKPTIHPKHSFGVDNDSLNTSLSFKTRRGARAPLMR